MAYSHIFGIRAGTLTLMPGMTLSQDDKGHWTGRAEFACLTGDFGTTPIQLALRKGTSLSQVSDQVGMEFSFLSLETVTARDERGGFTVIEVTYKGFNEDQWEFDSDLSKTYTRNTSIQEKTIFKHPVVQDFTLTYLQALKMGTDGKWIEREDSAADDMILTEKGNPLKPNVFATTDATFIGWWRAIVGLKNHTYKCPVTEWTVSTTGKAKLTDADFAEMGKVVTAAGVDGNPASAPDEKWMLTGVTEDIQISGEGSNSWSKTWTSSGRGGFAGDEASETLIYGTPTP